VRRSISILAIILMVMAGCMIIAGCSARTPANGDHERTGILLPGDRIPLPAPELNGTVSVEEAIRNRRSIREYAATPLDISEIAQLLWAAQGLTDPSGLRAAPSAGALYPLEISVACRNVTGLPDGVYRYLPESHALEMVPGLEIREGLYFSAPGQPSIRDAAAVIIIAADYNRTTSKYGERGIRYVHMEAGHAAENLYLQAYTLGIGTVAIGAFDDNRVRSETGLPPEYLPLYLMPVGKVSERVF
jgi:SagB-type dehydrogenase family enzyme